jgi:hypothetical protein
MLAEQRPEGQREHMPGVRGWLLPASVFTMIAPS